MRVPLSLSEAFQDHFQNRVIDFSIEEGLLPDAESLSSERFVSRSIVPHVQKLSSLFNRLETEQESGLSPYWKESSNPKNLRMAYFLYFMPCNLYRVASVIAELNRLGYRWPEQNTHFKGIEWGAGPASGACGVAAGEKHASLGIPTMGNWALIEQEAPMLKLGEKWAQTYFADQGLDWGVRPFRRKIDFSKPLLPSSAPRFHLWLSSYFLNECELTSEALSARLIENWEKHLEDEALIILVEPALKLQSRKLLALREALLADFERAKLKSTSSRYQILLPCLGHQVCGAFANPNDWCHEEVTWWRPPYFKKIDELSGLDRKTLPFSYLVIRKSKAQKEGNLASDFLPALFGKGSHQNEAPGGPPIGADPEKTERIMSPTHWEGQDLEFHICGVKEKRKARFRPPSEMAEKLGRGEILLNAKTRGDAQATRMDSLGEIVGMD